MDQVVRTRFAPSPTGELHLGGLRTALYAFLWARHHGSYGKFFVRMEDTDRERLVPGSAERILSTLRQFGIVWDEGPDVGGPFGPYVQSERLAQYQAHAERLLDAGKAYRCDCSPERLETLRAGQTAARQPTRYDRRCRERRDVGADRPHVIRFRTPEEGTIATEDLIHGTMAVAASTLDDFVLLKSDGYPTYHLAHVVDDHEMQTTHVIRGDEWLPSLPRHVLLSQASGWTSPAYAHLPLLVNSARKKLSKRDADTDVAAYLRWCLPGALRNFVALLGGNPTADRDVYTLEELIALFDLRRVHRSPAIVDFTKLEWMNGMYLRALDPTSLLDAIASASGVIGRDAATGQWAAAPDGRPIDEEYLHRAVFLEQPRLKRLDAFPPWYLAPYARTAPLEWKSTDAETTSRNLTLLRARLSTIDPWPSAPRELEDVVKPWLASEHLGVGETLWPMRVALSGQAASPSPFELAWLLGKEETLQRIDHAITELQS